MEIPKFFYLNDFYIFPLSVLYFHHRQDENRKWHSHNFSEIVLIVGGSGKHILNDRSCDISAGDILLIHPGAVHAYEHESLELINLIYDHRRIIIPRLDMAEFSLFHKFFPAAAAEPEILSPEPIMHLNGGELQTAKTILQEMRAEISALEPGRLFGALGLFMRFLLFVCRINNEKTSVSGDSKIVSRAVKYMKVIYINSPALKYSVTFFQDEHAFFLFYGKQLGFC